MRAYLSLSAGFLLSLGPVVGAGKGADLFTCRFDPHELIFTTLKEHAWGWWWGGEDGVNLIIIQISKRNQIHKSRHRLTKIQNNWLALTIQVSQRFRKNMFLGRRLINNLLLKTILTLGLLSSTDTQLSQLAHSLPLAMEWGWPWMGLKLDTKSRDFLPTWAPWKVTEN